MRRALLALLIPVAACGGDSSGPDVGFRCLGQALPDSAPALVSVSGQVRANALNPNALAGAAVFAFRTGDTTTLDADTSNTPGFYSLSITTGGTPVDGYLRLTHSGQITTYAYPSRPLAADLVTNVLMITSSEFDFLASLVSVTPTVGNGFIGVIVKNCDGTPIAGATVTTNPAGTVRYNAGSTPSPSATSTSSDGVAYVFNVAAGNVTVQANGGGHTLRQHVLNARADVITLTEIQP
jgi:hypothetical protein